MFNVQDDPRQPRITRKQLREWKRNAKAQAYRANGLAGANPDLATFPQAAVDRIEAARAKRARKAEKRLAALEGAAS